MLNIQMDGVKCMPRIPTTCATMPDNDEEPGNAKTQLSSDAFMPVQSEEREGAVSKLMKAGRTPGQ